MYSPVRQREYNKRAKYMASLVANSKFKRGRHMTNSGRQEIIRQREKQIDELRAFVRGVSIITEHRCPSCDAIDVVQGALDVLRGDTIQEKFDHYINRKG